MLIEFRVENYRSIRDEQALTMEAGRIGTTDDHRPRHVEGHNESLLPAAVIYGANASGKTNVLLALSFMREAVIHSHKYWDADGGVPRTPFAWGEKYNEPSLFEVTFILDRTKYAYGFTVDDKRVLEEWLFAWPKKRKQVWFERDGDDIKFGESLSGPNEIVREVTRSNALFVSTAAQHGHTALLPIHYWFTIIHELHLNTRSYEQPSAFELFGGSQPSVKWPDAQVLRVRELLDIADIGIVDVKLENSESPFRINGKRFNARKVFLKHDQMDERSWINLDQESAGTQTLFHMAPYVFSALESGGVLLVDELDSSLHPLLGKTIVKLFNDPKTNPHNAQIIFTTHDTNLLGTTLGEPPLRRDQIWFTEKDKSGATTLYPLTDYKPRKVENLERGYLQGRYGAIPFIGDLSWISG